MRLGCLKFVGIEEYIAVAERGPDVGVMNLGGAPR